MKVRKELTITTMELHEIVAKHYRGLGLVGGLTQVALRENPGSRSVFDVVGPSAAELVGTLTFTLEDRPIMEPTK
jgi:hypothetical protein